MNQKIITKVIATILVMILTMANFVTLGIYSVSYATSDNLENQTITSNDGNIEFDAYFAIGKGEKTHTIEKDINNKETKISLAVNVKKGYLKNANIVIAGENGESANFKMINNGETLTSVEKLDEKSGTISLKQINAGTGVKLEVPIEAIKEEIFDLSNFNKINKIKLTGTYVNNEGKASNIEQTIQTKIEWTSQAKVEVESKTKTFIPYKIGEKEETILQTELTTGLEQNSLPIQETNIKVQVPEIENKKPEKVIVTANTYATNNQEEEKFSEENYIYNEETGILNITVQNQANENKVAWNQKEKDTYIITYIYKGAKETITAEEKVKQDAEVIIKAYNSKATEEKGQTTLNIEEAEIKGNHITSSINTEEVISKGYLYTKAEKETQYKETLNTTITNQDIIDKITIEPAVDNFINSDGTVSPTTVGSTNYAYYKTTTISKENFEKVLGTDGTIIIYGANGEQLTTFNKESVTDENGNYTYAYTKETNTIKIETSKPITNNTLKIENTKSLKGKTDYSKEQVENFEKLQIQTKTTANYNNQEIATQEAKNEIQLIAPSTKIESRVSSSELSTIVKNENVEFRVILKTNDITCDLYKNPTVEIVLPSYIDELTIKDINLLYDKELEIKEYKTYKNDAGNTVIKVILTGEDTVYNQDQISKGANIVINTDITLKQLTPTTNDVMKVYVTNELATTYESAQQKKATTNRAAVARTVTNRATVTRTTTTEATSAYSENVLRAVAPVGMVTYAKMSGYNGEESITSVNGEATGKLAVGAEAKTATVNINVINNYANKITNTYILGRIPTEANKDILTGEDLGSNLTTTLENINAGGATVYYSENGGATKDLNNQSNGWSTNKTEKAKSYLIEIGEMATGETKDINYTIKIPANLSHNKQAYATHVVYFTNGATEDKQKAEKLGITTGEGAELEVKISSDIENGANVQEGQIITYTATVKNVGKSEANNITLTGVIPEGSVYVNVDDEGIRTTNADMKEYSETIASIKSGEEKSISYSVEVSSLNYQQVVEHDENGNEVIKDGEFTVIGNTNIVSKAYAKVVGDEAVYNSNEITNKIVEGFIDSEFSVEPIDETSYQQEGEEFTYILKLRNINSKDIKNMVITDVVPEGLSVVSVSENGKYDENTRTVTWKYDKFYGTYDETVTLRVKIDKLANDVYQKNIENKMTISAEDKTIETRTIKLSVEKPGISVTQTTNAKNGVVSVGDIVNFNMIIKNSGYGYLEDLEIEDTLPDELEFIGASYEFNGTSKESNINNENTVVVQVAKPITAADFITVTIQAKVKELPKGEKEKEITNVAKVSAKNIEAQETNKVTLKITSTGLAGGTGVNDPTTGEIQEGTHTITGTAWLDANENGIFDNSESTLGNIDVILINAENGQIVKDIVTGNNKQLTTDENGNYVFANLKPGKYIVVYLYDTTNYALTTYKKSGISEELNSDAIANKVQLNGETRSAAVTDAIEIKDSNVNGVNLGLVVNKKFDLKLDKVVSKITVTDSKGATKVNNCKDAKFAKADLNSKTINGANVVIEYKIRITNEGAIAGYAKKVVDYLPKEMSFSSSLNKDWYQAEDGNIYSSSLANSIIAPGETKELTLVLTKKMTSENTGNINNTAEIYESYNDFGIKDTDSTPANKVQNEDDISSADAILGVKTGEVYVYVVITLITISILGVGIYLINKKVLKKM